MANKNKPSGRIRAPAGPAWRSTSAVAVFLIAAAAGLAADLLSKHYVFDFMLSDPAVRRRARQYLAEFGPSLKTEHVLGKLCPRRHVCPGVQLTISTNPGVVFGLPMPRWAVNAVTVVMIGLVVYFFASAERRARLLHLALALILAGAAGNLYDRLASEVALPGMQPVRYHVRDFIDCSKLGWKWVFNVADALLVIGVAMIFLHWLLDRRRLTNDE